MRGDEREEKSEKVLTSSLLALHQSSGSVNADNETPRDLGIQRPAMTCLLHPENSPDPSHYLQQDTHRQAKPQNHSRWIHFKLIKIGSFQSYVDTTSGHSEWITRRSPWTS